MKRNLWVYLTVTIVVLGVVIWNPQNRIPFNAGGTVDIETDMLMVSVSTGRLEMVQQLSHELNQHPKDKRFRVISNWGDCGVSGRRVLVYDRSENTLQTWSEGWGPKSPGRNLSRADYEAVTENIIHATNNTDTQTWFKKGRRLYNFDFLLSHGAKKWSR